MENFCCTKCGSVDVFLDDRGSQKALMCNDCSSWIKWIRKKQLPFVERFIKENKENDNKKTNKEKERLKPDLYDFMGMIKDILSQVDDDKLDMAATNLKSTIDDLVVMEKNYADVGIRIREAFDEML